MSSRPRLGRQRRGISPIIATILLVTISVAAAAALYAWAPTALAPLMRSEAAEEYYERLSIVEVTTSGSNFTVYLINTGSATIEVDALYLIDPETGVTVKAYAFSPIEVFPGSLAYITLPLSEEDLAFINPDKILTFKVLTTAGTSTTSTLMPQRGETEVAFYTAYPSSYSLSYGSHVDGTLPDSVRWIDGDYFSIASEPTSTSTSVFYPENYVLLHETSLLQGGVEDLAADDGEYMVFESYREVSEVDYHPSSYETLGSTVYVSGALSDLVSSDDSYMVFESYPAQYSVRAFTVYRSGAGTESKYPKARWWNGTGWEDEERLEKANYIYWIKVASHPSQEEKVAAVMTWQSPTASLYAYVWDGEEWSFTQIASGLESYYYRTRCFDVAYEQESGRAILVYAKSSASSTQDFAYRIWDGNSWSQQYWVDDPSVTSLHRIYWMRLVSKPGSNEIGLIYVYYDSLLRKSYVRACIWDGESWGNWQTISGGGIRYNPTTEICGIAYESQSKGLIATSVYYRYQYQVITYEWTGSSWVNRGVIDPNPNANEYIRWIMLKSDPSSDRVMLMCTDTAYDLSTALWTGSSWTDKKRHDGYVESYARRCFDGDWEPSGSRFLLVWGHANYDGIYYKTWSTSGWSSEYTYQPSGVTDVQWVRVEGCPLSVGDVKVMVEVMDDGQDLTALTWDGSSFTSAKELTSTSYYAYECFDLCFENFQSPIEQVIELEFSGSSDLNLWSSLTWGVEIGLNVDYAVVQLQLYDYTNGEYPSSGDGFQEFAAISSDAEHFQVISSNPEHFRGDDGSWRMKLRAVKFSSNSFRVKLDVVSYRRSYDTCKAEVELIGTADVVNYDWLSLTWALDLSFNVSDVTATLQLYNYDEAAYPTSGEGYDSFTASSAGTDYTRVNDVSESPESFRSTGGEWKVKVSASILNRPPQIYPFTMSLDFVEYEPSYYDEQSLDVEFTFTDVDPPYEPDNYKFAIDLRSTESIELTFYFWNHTEGGWSLLGSYAWSGSGNASFTVNATQCVEGGIAKLRIAGSSSGLGFQLDIDRLRLLALQG